MSDETLQHVVNCGWNDERVEDVEHALLDLNSEVMKTIASRVDEFLSKVEV